MRPLQNLQHAFKKDLFKDRFSFFLVKIKGDGFNPYNMHMINVGKF